MAGVVGYLRACRNRALDAGRARTRSAAECLIGCSNCMQGGCLVEVTNVTGMIFIDPQKVVRLHISNVIETQNDTRLQFALHTEIHLEGARRLKIGGVHSCQSAGSKAILKQSSQIAWVGQLQV